MICDSQLLFYWEQFKDYKIVVIHPNGTQEAPISLRKLYEKWEEEIGGKSAIEFFKQYCEDAILKVDGPNPDLAYLKYTFMRIQTYYLYDYYESYPNNPRMHPSFEIYNANNFLVSEIPSTQWKFWVEAMDY